MKDRNYLIIAIGIFLALFLHAYLIGSALQRFQKEVRYISVKGFAEKEVKANLAVWNIKTKITTNNLQEGSAEIENGKNKLVQFLLQKGINRDEIIQMDLNVVDKVARDYGSNDIGAYRYIIENSLQVRSENVENVQKVSRMDDELLKTGVVISNDQAYMGKVQYLFTKLNDIKPAMLTEATKNAKKAALQFSNESDVTLDNLRKANQGLFTIIDRDEFSSAQGDGGGYQNLNDINKKVRVVVSVDYYIK